MAMDDHISIYIKYKLSVFITCNYFLHSSGPVSSCTCAPCSDPNYRDKGTHLVFGPLKLLKPKAHFTILEGILIHELTCN